ncbi:hypothetical protein Dsin_007717 [Dipteronia sinensis]|uniref:Uncharacterized protein n=1 Tax=Dipteronia sinensis TaxID=43782 RepID=A0AAE0B247_9ROSI|nr:hypothetical protein Dsin_007717 [Dipteronia sinensis]
MATTSLLRANQLLFSSRRQNFHENACCIRSTKLIISRRFNGFKAKSFLDSTSSASNTGKTKTAAFPFKLEEKTTTSTGSNPKGNNFYDEVVFSTILKTLKWLKVPASFSSSSSSSSKSSSSSSSSSRSSSSGSKSRSSSGSGSGSPSSSYRSSSGRSSGSSSSSYRSSTGSSSGSSRSGGVMGGHSFSSSSSSKPSSSSSSSSSRPSSSSSSSSSWPSSSSSSNDYHSYESSSTKTRSSSPDWYSSSSYHTSSSSSPSATATTDKVMTKPKVQERAQVQSKYSEEELQEFWHALINAVVIMLALIVLDVMFYISLNMFNNWREARQNRTRVIKLQVGMHICESSFEKSINRIAETADTSTSKTTKALSNHSASWLAVNSSVKVNGSIEEAEEYFKKLSIDEREKYDKETLINLDNVKSDSISDQKDDNNMSRDRDRDTYMVAVNVVWTPQDENEVMSREELYQVYPTLHEIGGD